MNIEAPRRQPSLGEKPLGIATYTVTPQLPASYRGELPSAEEIAKRLEGWVDGDVDGAGE